MVRPWLARIYCSSLFTFYMLISLVQELDLCCRSRTPLYFIWSSQIQGTHAGEEGLGARLASWIITLGGLVSFAILIGIVGDTIQSKVESLKKGKSVVLEDGHTLVCASQISSPLSSVRYLGGAQRYLVFLKILQLHKKVKEAVLLSFCQVLLFNSVFQLSLIDDDLSPEDKMELIESHCADLKRTTVILRSGNLMSAPDLKKVHSRIF